MKGYVRKHGNHWYYRIDVAKKDGKRRQIERFAGNTYHEALQTLRRVVEKYESTSQLGPNTTISVNDYFEFWFDNYVKKHLSGNTQNNYRNILDKYILPELGTYQMKKVSPKMLQKFIDKVAESTEYKQDQTRLSKHSVEIVMSVAKEAFKQAVHPWQIIDSSPALYISMPRYRTPRKTKEDLKIINMNQFNQLIRMYPKGHVFYLPIMVSFFTGMRRGEVCGLEWKNVDLQSGQINVHQQMLQYSQNDIRLGKPKTAASYRTIEIGKKLTTILEEQRLAQRKNKLKYGRYYYDSDFVCVAENGKPVTPNQIKYYSSKAEQELKFPFNFHSLRHTHATMLLEAGASPKEVQVRLGHTRISTTLDTYVHLTTAKKKQTADLFDNAFNALT